tara:strand:+ start:367 stop:594 length:228 start_codon:yes stop_codon:yes gene_type:complete
MRTKYINPNRSTITMNSLSDFERPKVKKGYTKHSPKLIKIHKRVPYLTRIAIDNVKSGHTENKMTLELQSFIKSI